MPSLTPIGGEHPSADLASLMRTRGHLRFCTLAYRPGVAEPALDGKTILLLVEESSASLLLFVSPDLDGIVEAKDIPYVDGLLEDLAARSALAPTELFQHVSRLSLGPIVTHQTGTLCEERDYLESLCAPFERFRPAGL